MRRLIVVAAILAATPAAAADRTWPVSSFERLRVEGPVGVTVTRGSPAARAEAADRATLSRLSIQRDGAVLVVRLAGAPPAGLGAADGVPVVRVTLSTPRLSAVTQQGTGAVSVARLTGERADLSTTGGGALTVTDIEARMLVATLVGGGRMTLAGAAARARLTLNGEGLLDAAALVADEVAVSSVGMGELRADARYAAQVVAAEGADVTVTGKARCTVRAARQARVRCGR